MTDEMRLADIRSMKRHQLLTYSSVEFLLRLLDTARSERDAALSRAERLEELSARVLDDYIESREAALSESTDALSRALSPPEYPPEQT